MMVGIWTYFKSFQMVTIVTTHGRDRRYIGRKKTDFMAIREL